MFCVNALYDARQLGHIASAFSKVREREIANSQIALCKKSFCILRIPISAFAESEKIILLVVQNEPLKKKQPNIINPIFFILNFYQHKIRDNHIEIEGV